MNAYGEGSTPSDPPKTLPISDPDLSGLPIVRTETRQRRVSRNTDVCSNQTTPTEQEKIMSKTNQIKEDNDMK